MIPPKNGSTSQGERDWWRQACVYQIYPRSFYDSNGDGIGDLKGITEKVPYLVKLGIDAVWLSPFYPSALKDGGYDVSDYRAVDPRIGTLDDFDEMVTAFEAEGIKVIIDIVPNHSSDEHAWFREALSSGKGSAARERYIFRDGVGPNKDQPPTDWESIFGGSAWEPVGGGQFYLHLFDTSQPDFNWEHPEVRSDFLRTLRFWADRGVSGYRVDIAHGLAKDLDFSSAMGQREQQALYFEKMQNGMAGTVHPLWDRDEVQSIYREWRRVFNEYDPPLIAVAEASVAPDRRHVYASPDSLGACFSFDLMLCEFSRDQFKAKIQAGASDAEATGNSTTWVLSSHDVIRHATRYGLPKAVESIGESGLVQFCPEWLRSGGKQPYNDTALGSRRARAATLMMLALPGSAYLYQGEELGLQEVAVIEKRQDPTFFRTNGDDLGRDGCRVPLPWTRDGKNFGFGPGSPPHLAQPEWFGEFAVEAQEGEDGSTLDLYRKALKLRRQLQTRESMEWVEEDGGADILHFKRDGGWEVVMNFEGKEVEVPEGAVVLLASGKLDGRNVPANTTVWFKR